MLSISLLPSRSLRVCLPLPVVVALLLFEGRLLRPGLRSGRRSRAAHIPGSARSQRHKVVHETFEIFFAAFSTLIIPYVEGSNGKILYAKKRSWIFFPKVSFA